MHKTIKDNTESMHKHQTVITNSERKYKKHMKIKSIKNNIHTKKLHIKWTWIRSVGDRM